jgi:hypothetical protein
MKWPLSLGRISGIEVFVHWTFLILIAWILFSHINMGLGWEQSLMGVLDTENITEMIMVDKAITQS